MIAFAQAFVQIIYWQESQILDAIKVARKIALIDELKVCT